MYEFTNDCLIGIKEIDDEHAKLFKMINDAISMGNELDDIAPVANNLISGLKDYAATHFAHEEAYMEQIRDPELIRQRMQHSLFRDKIRDFSFADIDAPGKQQQVVTDLLNFLAKWLYGHILSSDIMIGKLPAADDWMLRDNPCEFTDEFRTGIDFIDNEHQELFRIIERANNLVKALVSDSYDDIMSILGELEDYTKFHFSEEEEYMESIHYEGLEAQKRAHAAFIDRLEQVDPDEIDANPQEYLNELLEFLLNWLINHILYTDKKIPDVTK